MATSIEDLYREIRASARREEFPIDVPVYERFQKDPFRTRGRSEARFDSVFPCRLPVPDGDHSRPRDKLVSVMSLPHPSPLNRRWLSDFPAMLARRLSQVRRESAGPDSRSRS